MRIGILGAANSIHIVRIVNELVRCGHNVTVMSLPNHKDINNEINANVKYLKYSGEKGYFINYKEVKKIVSSEKIDILNAHYASGYGTLGRLAGFKPYVISLWGSDIYSFPKKSLIKQMILRANLRSTDCLFSTSECMAVETSKYISNKNIVITPFGVDISKFSKLRSRDSNKNKIVVGFLKGTDEIYGIDVFLDIIEKLEKVLIEKGIDLEVKICGGGDRAEWLFKTINKKELRGIVKYYGKIRHNDMPEFINACDVICITSLRESFGVVAIEAMACEIPCVVSEAPGLVEVVVDEVTGYIIHGNKISNYVEKIATLSENPELRLQMGRAGREHVINKYNFENNIAKLGDSLKVLI